MLLLLVGELPVCFCVAPGGHNSCRSCQRKPCCLKEENTEKATTAAQQGLDQQKSPCSSTGTAVGPGTSTNPCSRSKVSTTRSATAIFSQPERNCCPLLHPALGSDTPLPSQVSESHVCCPTHAVAAVWSDTCCRCCMATETLKGHACCPTEGHACSPTPAVAVVRPNTSCSCCVTTESLPQLLTIAAAWH
jgi:hypothetical protein